MARQAREAANSGQIFRAYLLFAEAAARDPNNSTYRANRDAIAPAAKVLTQAQVQNADITLDIKAAEATRTTAEPPVEIASEKDWSRDPDLQPLPTISPNSSLQDFNLRTDEKTLFQQVATAYGVRAIWDPQLQPESNIRFELTQADFHTAMEALTAVTHTFVFPISQHVLFFVRDTEAKRNELEPTVLLSFPLPNSLDQKDLVDAANAIRGALNLRAIGWDTANRTVMIRDRYSRAQAARSLFDAVLLPKGQVSLEIQFLTYDSDRNYHYGLALPTATQVVDFGSSFGFKSLLPTSFSNAAFLGFGGGTTLFGIGIAAANLFANFTDSQSSALYDATVVVADGQTANFHIGDKYPIPQSIYTGFQTTGSSALYNPIGQVTMEDLGIILKLTPRVSGAGDVAIDVEANLKSLGTQTFNTVPAIAEREFKGNVTMREGQWAIISGLDTDTRSVTRNGIAGLSQIPGLSHILAENTRDTASSKTLLVIKPTITRLPMSSAISPQYLLGPVRGERVLL